MRLCLDSPGGCKPALELLGLGGDARLRVAANGRDFGDVLVAGGERHVEIAMPYLSGDVELAFHGEPATAGAGIGRRAAAILPR